MQDPVYAWLNRPETWMISSFCYYYYFAPSLRAHGTIHSHICVGYIYCESDDSRIYVRTRSLSACCAYTTAAARLLLRRPMREVAKNNRPWPPFRPAEYNIICLLTIQYTYRRVPRVPTWWPTTTSCSSGSPLRKVSTW